MSRKLTVGILRETKIPPDRRVPLAPYQLIKLQAIYPNVRFVVQPSSIRCYSDDEYLKMGIPLEEDLSICDILMGVKEVNIDTFIPGKTYMFFAHVAKKQPHNKNMFQHIVKKGINLIDYEYLTKEDNCRAVAFGRWAGILGSYHGLRAVGIKTGRYQLKSPHDLKDFDDLKKELGKVRLDRSYKILLTGRGRVSQGIMEVLSVCKLKIVKPEDFIEKEYNEPVFCQVSSKDYYKHKNGNHFNIEYFHKRPEEYISTFQRFTKVTDLLITGHYWDSRYPVFYTNNEMRESDFKISVIADITCDVNGSIPSTIRSTTLEEPYFYYDPLLETESPDSKDSRNLLIMSIDNLASDLPRDASEDFGEQLINNVLPDLFSCNPDGMIKRATLTKDFKITPSFEYLNDYLIT